MENTSLKQKRNILRLLSCFERHLKDYDEFFNNDYFQMSYIVHRCYFGGDLNIEVTMNIWNKKYFFESIETTWQVLSSLKSYCSVFSMQQIKVVRQIKKPALDLNLQERISYGVYQKIINWSFWSFDWKRVYSFQLAVILCLRIMVLNTAHLWLDVKPIT